MACCWGWCLGFYDQWEQEPWSGPHGIGAARASDTGGCSICTDCRWAEPRLLVSPGRGRGSRRSACVAVGYVVMLDFGISSRESNLRVQWPLLCFCAGSHSARRALLAQKICNMPQRSQNSLLVEKTRSRRPLQSLQTHKSAGRTQRLNSAATVGAARRH